MSAASRQGGGCGDRDRHDRGARGDRAQRPLPEAVVDEALRHAALPLDPSDPDHDQYVDAELEKLVALLRWCEEVDSDFWRDENVPLMKRIAMTTGEDVVTLRRTLNAAKKVLAERRTRP